ncbi:hypothetical protein SRB5_00580 [Streptomyces sp. RB5]|uniref:Uncharacterized protein n=1 Tax=Streptomyces smaragdinus TaxID=2585196 RepID=A0A7K0CAZ6_9ACTN|nr:hypothetical protein [Streptomyces smaragdinus]MQY09954.1 hypothetical protein [Streptomyces smaragdinus]
MSTTDLLDLADAHDEESAAEQLHRWGWTDGLPVVVPTPERVERFLAAATRDADAVLGPVAPRGAELTLRRLAANAVMAGCLPEYMPVLEAAVVAMQQNDFNLYGMQMTTHPCALMVMVQGPLTGELAVAAGAGCMGAGFRANGTIGRAVRLVAMNIGGARPGEGEVAGDIDRATQGSPAKWSFCFAENHADSPWPAFASGFAWPDGWDPADNLVTVAAVEGPHNINDHQSSTGENLLKTIAATMSTPGANTAYRGGDQYLALGPEHARVLADSGLGRRDVQEYLHEHARVDATRVGPEKLEEASLWGGYRLRLEEWGHRVPISRAPEDIRIVVAGGTGKHSAWMPTFGATWSQTVRLPRTPGGDFTLAPLNETASWPNDLEAE